MNNNTTSNESGSGGVNTILPGGQFGPYCDWRIQYSPLCAFSDSLNILFIINLVVAGLAVVFGLFMMMYRQCVMRLPFLSQELRLFVRPLDFLFLCGWTLGALRFAQVAIIYFQVPMNTFGLEMFYEAFFVGANVAVLYYLYAIIIILPEDLPPMVNGQYDFSRMHYNYSKLREAVVWILGIIPLSNFVWAGLTGYYLDNGNVSWSNLFFKVHYFAWGGYNIVEFIFYFFLGGRVLVHMRTSFKLQNESISSSLSDSDAEQRAVFKKRVIEYRRMQVHVYLFSHAFLLLCAAQVIFAALRPQILSSEAWYCTVSLFKLKKFIY